jgi:hypothetical protein
LNKKIRTIESSTFLTQKGKEMRVKELKLRILDVAQKANGKAKESLLP